MPNMSQSPGLYFSDPSSLQHDPRVLMRSHPDVPERMRSIEALLAQEDWLGWERRAAPAASECQLELIHDARHVARIRELAAAGGGAADPDTVVGEDSYRAALHAAGGACAMVSALLAGEASVGFSALRPPGHHAEADRAMGFCLFNNVAVAAEWARRELGVERVLILDWDVHHGNGTAEAFRTRADVLYVSLHQYPFYPGTGPLQDAGSGAGEGFTINLPVPAGSGEELWSALLASVVLPAARAFAPGLVLVSAGYDAHRADPLGSCLLSEHSFGELTRHMRELARELGAPLGVVLEGGYEPAALARSVRETMRALTDQRLPGPAALEDAPIASALAQVGRYWPL
jgi:acetoin utilization deacetylase AcuC-like enzyme